MLEVFKVFAVDRVQQRFRSRSPSFPIQVEVVKIFSQSRAPEEKKREDPAHPGVGTGCRVELMDAVSLAGVCTVAQHGVRRFLLVAERQEWCSLVCSSGLPSYPVAWSSRWCRLCAGAALCQPLGSFWMISSSASFCCSRRSHLEIWTPQQWTHVPREALDEFHTFSTSR